MSDGTPIAKRPNALPPPPPAKVGNHIPRMAPPASQSISATAPNFIGAESAAVTNHDGSATYNYTQNRMYYRTDLMNGTDEAARREVERLNEQMANHNEMQANLLSQLQQQITENNELRSDANAQIRKIEENNVMSVEQIGRALLRFQEDVSRKINNIENKIRNEDKILVIVGAEKVPREVYELADYNVAIGNQPHSEISALSVLLDRIYQGKQFESDFDNPERVIIPQEHGKNVVTNKTTD